MPRLHLATAVAGSGLLLAGCIGSAAPRKATFLHIDHRLDYEFAVDELKNADFYVEPNLLAHNVSDPGLPTAEAVVLATRADPGRVVAGGPDWLRVTFGGGTGVVFLSKCEKSDQAYYLATEVPGETGWHRVIDLDEKYVIYDGERYDITYGSSTLLQIDWDDLRELIESRGLQNRIGN